MPADPLKQGLEGPRSSSPDLVEELIGHRLWVLDDQGDLRSPSVTALWREGTLAWNLACKCRAGVTSEYLYEVCSDLYHPHAEWAWYAWSGRISAGAPHEMRDDLIGLIDEADDCRCGVNAFDNALDLLGSSALKDRNTWAAPSSSAPVIGEVALSGHVRVFARGYRAEKARVVSLSAMRFRDRSRVRTWCAANNARYDGLVRPWVYWRMLR